MDVHAEDNCGTSKRGEEDERGTGRSRKREEGAERGGNERLTLSPSRDVDFEGGSE